MSLQDKQLKALNDLISNSDTKLSSEGQLEGNNETFKPIDVEVDKWEEREAESFREEEERVDDYHSSRCESELFSQYTN